MTPRTRTEWPRFADGGPPHGNPWNCQPKTMRVHPRHAPGAISAHEPLYNVVLTAMVAFARATSRPLHCFVGKPERGRRASRDAAPGTPGTPITYGSPLASTHPGAAAGGCAVVPHCSARAAGARQASHGGDLRPRVVIGQKAVEFWGVGLEGTVVTFGGGRG